MKTTVFFALLLASLCVFSEEAPIWVNMSKGDIAINDKAMKSAKEWAEKYYVGVKDIVEYAYRISRSETELNVMITPIYSVGVVIEHSEMCLDIEEGGKVSSARNCYAP